LNACKSRSVILSAGRATLASEPKSKDPDIVGGGNVPFRLSHEKLTEHIGEKD